MWVIKIGGSLLKAGRSITSPLLREMEELSRIEPLLVLVGGGTYADLIRKADRRHGLGEAAHWMAILGMHMNAYNLASHSSKALHLTEQPRSFGRFPLQILLPYELLKASPLPKSWEVTSDSIAAYVASQLRSKLALIKPVDGILSPFPGGTLLSTISPQDLLTLRESPLDPYFGRILLEEHLDTWIINGFQPERLTQLLTEGATTGTHIYTAGLDKTGHEAPR